MQYLEKGHGKNWHGIRQVPSSNPLDLIDSSLWPLGLLSCCCRHQLCLSSNQIHEGFKVLALYSSISHIISHSAIWALLFFEMPLRCMLEPKHIHTTQKDSGSMCLVGLIFDKSLTGTGRYILTIYFPQQNCLKKLVIWPIGGLRNLSCPDIKLIATSSPSMIFLLAQDLSHLIWDCLRHILWQRKYNNG